MLSFHTTKWTYPIVLFVVGALLIGWVSDGITGILISAGFCMIVSSAILTGVKLATKLAE